MTEARVGSLPWFAGVFWLLLSMASHKLAALAFYVGDAFPRLERPAWSAAWKLIGAVNKCNKMATRCAIEAGAEL
jgi:hypothetical protein